MKFEERFSWAFLPEPEPAPAEEPEVPSESEGEVDEEGNPIPKKKKKLDKWDWEKRINKDWCRECRNNNVVEEFSSGDVVCADCGLVLTGGIVDTRSEWRTFSNDDETGADPNRVGDGGNAHLLGAQLGTLISMDKGGVKMNATHRKVAVYTKNDKFNERLKASHARIDAYCGHANLSRDVQDTAKQILKQLVIDKVGSKFSEAELAAILYLALKQRGVGRSFSEILTMTNVEKKPFCKAFKKYQMALQKRAYKDERKKANAAPPKNPPTEEEKARSPSPPSEEYLTEITPQPTEGELDTGPVGIKNLLPRYLGALMFPPWAQQFGDKIADAVGETQIMGSRGASTSAPATVFILGCLIGHSVNVDAVASLSGRQPITIRNAIALFLSNREKLVTSKHWPTDPRIIMSKFPMKVTNEGFGAVIPRAPTAPAPDPPRKRKVPTTDRNFTKRLQQTTASAAVAVETTPVVKQEDKAIVAEEKTVAAPVPQNKTPMTDRKPRNPMLPSADTTTPVANKGNVVPQLPTPPYNQSLAGVKRKAEPPQLLERVELPDLKRRKAVPKRRVEQASNDEAKEAR